MTTISCKVPVHRDAGATDENPSKYYLVTGTNVEAPGAYISWPSADAQYKKAPGATLKGYTPAEWRNLEAAWGASCARGEHPRLHGPLGNTSSAGPSATPRTPRRARTNPLSPTITASGGGAPRSTNNRRPAIISRSPSTSPSRVSSVTIDSDSSSPSPPPTTQARDCVPSGLRVYAVRSGHVGQVFDCYNDARDHFHALQNAGKHPVFGVHDSLTAAVCFIERLTVNGQDERAGFIRAEVAAHRARLLLASPSIADLSGSE
ncbi:hypothetical protein C8R47DRAFT_1211926 [Mycena vitilis]|nr:hypothetical protein C8R47DRAFT_1231177 [Mycena vitilis]KAJ6499633.1 hypothetical protein C8R47DRAFT_1211926 [Mycena vitilis]